MNSPLSTASISLFRLDSSIKGDIRKSANLTVEKKSNVINFSRCVTLLFAVMLKDLYKLYPNCMTKSRHSFQTSLDSHNTSYYVSVDNIPLKCYGVMLILTNNLTVSFFIHTSPQIRNIYILRQATCSKLWTTILWSKEGVHHASPIKSFFEELLVDGEIKNGLCKISKHVYSKTILRLSCTTITSSVE